MKDERDKRRGESINKAIDEAAPESRRKALRDTIAELFPTTYHLLGHTSKKYADYEAWQRERRVAWPDALDDYFAGSLKREVYDTQLKKINNLLSRVDTTDDEKLVEHYRNYLDDLGQEDRRDDIRLLTNEILHRRAGLKQGATTIASAASRLLSSMEAMLQYQTAAVESYQPYFLPLTDL